jgi:hypothetical protein
MSGSGTKDDPWHLKTPPGSSSYTIHRDDTVDPPILVCVVGKTTLTYQARCLDDLRLKKGLRGRFGVYIPPLMEALGMAELEHNARANRMRAG